MKLGNGTILNTKDLTSTKIKTNKKIFYGQDNQHMVLQNGSISALVMDGDGAFQFATYSRTNKFSIRSLDKE